MSDLSNYSMKQLIRLYAAKEITESQLLNEVDKRHTEALIKHQKEIKMERYRTLAILIIAFVLSVLSLILAT